MINSTEKSKLEKAMQGAMKIFENAKERSIKEKTQSMVKFWNGEMSASSQMIAMLNALIEECNWNQDSRIVSERTPMKQEHRVYMVARPEGTVARIHPAKTDTIVGSWFLEDYTEFLTELTDEILEQSDGSDDIVWAVNHVLKEYL